MLSSVEDMLHCSEQGVESHKQGIKVVGCCVGTKSLYIIGYIAVWQEASGTRITVL